MKKLSIEEKAKAYDEVLNKLRHFIAKGVDPLITRADVQDFFSELAESEDEKTRKEIISHLQHEYVVKRYVSDVEYYRWIAWLEKQKGNIGGISANWSEDDEVNVYNIIHFLEEPSMLENNEPCKKIVIDWLKSLRPQNRWKPSEGDIIILEKLINGELEPKVFQATLQGILEQLKKL